MNKDGKKVPGWDFEKTVKVPVNIEAEWPRNWEVVKSAYNELMEEHGDLYMHVSKLPEPGRMERIKLKLRGYWAEHTGKVKFQHEQVYRFFEALAVHLETDVGTAVHRVLYETEDLRDELGLGETLNVQFMDMGAGEPSKETEDSKVSEDELKEMINDE